MRFFFQSGKRVVFWWSVAKNTVQVTQRWTTTYVELPDYRFGSRIQPSFSLKKRSVPPITKTASLGRQSIRSIVMFGRCILMTLKEFASPLPRVEAAVPACTTSAGRSPLLYRFAV